MNFPEILIMFSQNNIKKPIDELLLFIDFFLKMKMITNKFQNLKSLIVFTPNKSKYFFSF